MPLVKKTLTLAAGATSEQVLAGTTYEYVGPNTRLVVAAGVDNPSGSATANKNANLQTVMNFNVNNAEFARDVSVSNLVDGEPFGWKGNYVMNDMITTAIERNRPIITFTNKSAATVQVEVAVFIGG
jgi:hypothetical protein